MVIDWKIAREYEELIRIFFTNTQESISLVRQYQTTYYKTNMEKMCHQVAFIYFGVKFSHVYC